LCSTDSEIETFEPEWTVVCAQGFMADKDIEAVSTLKFEMVFLFERIFDFVKPFFGNK
jgi:hypothetical protein